ncbi:MULTISPECIES: hypothetical protein [Paenibacillus]|uniref:hypothetical protein n=2 Tax=Paenibacillus TaxID=44249 RepID=UPI001C3FC386|nr:MULTISPECIES: hypothetical protein [Paenibacillus]
MMWWDIICLRWILLTMLLRNAEILLRAEYNWFVSDIATPLFYEIPIPWVVSGYVRKEIAKRYYCNFLNGYCQENTVIQAWLNKIPLFINFRQARVLAALYKSRDSNALLLKH